MAQTVKIKRSTTTAAPSALENGELAYSSNSDKLYIGRPGGTTGDVDAIGGKHYTDIVDSLATVATTGAYSDLSGTPTNVSTFTNDAGYLTSETSHADVVVDGDFTSSGLMKRGASAGTYSIVTDNSSNWNTAYGWGDHSTAGYLTSYTETDPVFSASEAASITSTDTSNWDTAFGWGDHSTQGYLTSYTETDPVFSASEAASITSTDTTNWDTAFSWGNHASAGYLTSETSHADVVVDGDFTTNGLMKRTAAGVYAIVTDNSTNWNTAYGWGDHASAGYLTSYTETDTLDTVTDRGASTTNALTVGGLTINGNLTVSGTTTTVNTETINLADNIVTLNSNETGTPSQNAGIEVERGTSTNRSLIWNESTDQWEFTNDGQPSTKFLQLLITATTQTLVSRRLLEQWCQVTLKPTLL
jgi:hypothetical protein